MYSVSSNIAKIDGLQGKYDNIVNNSSARYGRNSVDNYRSYIADYKFDSVDLSGLAQMDKDAFDKTMNELDERLKKLPPLDFEYRYSENGLDTISLMGASYEEMGGAKVSVKQMNKDLKAQFQQPGVLKQIWGKIVGFFKGEKTDKINFHPVKVSAKAVDLNKDKHIDLAEYGATILAMDKLSDGKIDGSYTKDGENKFLAYLNVKNRKAAKAQIKELYNTYNLAEAQNAFLSDENNIQG